MTRVKRSVHARKKRRATLALAKGYRGDASRHYRIAKEAVLKADQYRYRDRRNRKRDFRRLWITRINAAARQQRHVLLAVHARPPAAPASSWTARCSPTSRSATPTPSDALPTAPARRWRPADERRPTSTANRAPLHQERRLFCSQQMTITSPHNQKLKEIRKLRHAPPLARARRAVRRRGRGSARGCRRGRVGAGRAVLRGRQRPARGRGRARAAGVSASGLGSGTRALAVYEERWAPAPARAAVRVPARRPRSGQRRRGAALAPQAFGASSRRARPRHRRPVRPQGGARQHGRGVRASRSRAPTASPRSPGPRSRSCAGRGAPAGRSWLRLTSSERQDVTLLIGAEREGLPEDVIAAADQVAHIPIADRIAQRRDGGHDRCTLYELTRMAPRMIDRIEQIEHEAEAAIDAAADTDALEDVRIRYLGRKAELPNLLRSVAAAPARGARRRRQGGQRRRARRSSGRSQRAQQALAAGELEQRLRRATASTSRCPADPLPGDRAPAPDHPDAARDRGRVHRPRASTSPRAPRSRPSTTTSTRSTTPSTHPSRLMTDTFYIKPVDGHLRSRDACCCACTPRRCRCARWRASRRRSTSSCRAASTGPTPTRPTRRSSTRSRGWRSTPTSRWPTCRGRC